MSPLSVLIVDDESPARKRLRKMLEPFARSGRVEIVGEAADGLEAYELLHEDPVDLVFLDIRMPGLDGFDLLERLDPAIRPEVVFVTAHDDYAIAAFDAHAVDYLLKPISKDRLAEAIERAQVVRSGRDGERTSEDRIDRLLDWLDDQRELEQSSAPPHSTEAPLRRISIPYRDKTLVIPIERVITAEIVDGLTRMTILDPESEGKGKTSQYVVGYTLEHLESRLDPEAFMRVHRSAIVALDHIREVQNWFSGRQKLKMTGGHEVIASRDRSRILKERLSI